MVRYLNEVTEAGAALGLPNGRALTWSKSRHYASNPGHAAFFNASIADDTGRPVWWGDLDLTSDEAALVALSRATGLRLHILAEESGAEFDTRDGVFEVGRSSDFVDPSGDFMIRRWGVATTKA